ncbi:MAG: hypothetical protein GF334_11885 [Candidatus Altiarchaeales archaeon]|nr:hypothetical protein [Candidatus Altiarchaeales archaeon]
MIRLSNPSFLTPQEDDTSMGVLKSILRKRGFEYSKDTPCEIWGASIASCVKDAALQFEQSGFANITIPGKTTDLLNRNREIEKLSQKLKENNPGTKIKIENRT